MKKYLLGLVLIMLIAPSVAMASWWNPLSWFNNWHFSGAKRLETEALKNRISELESKLEDSKPIPIENTKDKTEELKSSEAVIDSYSLNLLNSTNTKIDSYIVVLNKRRDDYKGQVISLYSVQNPNTDQVTFRNLVETFNNDRISDLDFMLDKLKGYKKLVLNYKELIKTSYQRDSIVSLNESISELFIAIDSLVSKQEDLGKEFMDRLNALVDQKLRENKYVVPSPSSGLNFTDCHTYTGGIYCTHY